MLRAALVCLALMGVMGTARADTMSTLVKADTLAVHSADSSAVVNVSNAARLWLDFIIPPGPACANCAYSASTDTAVVLMVEAREILNAGAGTDSVAVGTQIGSQTNNPAAFSDSTVIPWIPAVSGSGANGVAAADTALAVNGIAPTIYGRASYQFKVVIPTRFIAGGVQSRRVVRLDLINPTNGAPFRTQFSQFKWYMVAGPACTRLRVVLGMETF
jgi:hypothetical protein